MVVLALPASTGLFMLSKEVILIISGSHFIRAESSLRILCFANLFAILTWILNDCVLIPSKREKYMLKNTIISALLNIVFNLIFIPFWNENAAAISTILAEASMFILNYHYTKDIVENIFISKKFLKNITASLLGCTGIAIVCFLCNLEIKSLILKISFSVLFSIIVYGVILLILRNEIAINALNKIKEMRNM